MTVFIASALGSIHCASMCGPLVLVVADNRKTAVTYHLGRLLGYCSLGALFGFLGDRLLSMSAFHALPFIGTLLLAAVFVALGVRQMRGQKLHFKFNLPSCFKALYGRALRGISDGHSRCIASFLVGLLSVFLPCGWLYTFLLAATGTQDARAGAALLVAFWAGTLPALLVGPLLFQRFVRPFKTLVPRLSGALLIGAGLLTLVFRIIPTFSAPPLSTKTSIDSNNSSKEILCPLHKH